MLLSVCYLCVCHTLWVSAMITFEPLNQRPFSGVRRRPHILLCRAVIVPNDSVVLTNTVTVDCGLSLTLLYIFDCSENATAELGSTARYQAHPASVPSTGHRAVSLFQLTEV